MKNIISKTTEAKNLLCAVGDWKENVPMHPASKRGRTLSAYYATFGLMFAEDRFTSISLGESAPDVIEISSIISYPDRKGCGRTVMDRLCRLADEIQVTLWLNARPFGRDRDAIPIGVLKQFYASFGFFPVRKISPRWINSFHKLGGTMFRDCMQRNPGPVSGIRFQGMIIRDSITAS